MLKFTFSFIILEPVTGVSMFLTKFTCNKGESNLEFDCHVKNFVSLTLRVQSWGLCYYVPFVTSSIGLSSLLLHFILEMMMMVVQVKTCSKKLRNLNYRVYLTPFSKSYISLIWTR